jgi:hypothetical protein
MGSLVRCLPLRRHRSILVVISLIYSIGLAPSPPTLELIARARESSPHLDQHIPFRLLQQQKADDIEREHFSLTAIKHPLLLRRASSFYAHIYLFVRTYHFDLMIGNNGHHHWKVCE